MHEGGIWIEDEEWSTEIKVGDAIVDLLSGRIYRTLPIALKELISNSWDADASTVKILIHKDREQIAIIDDGKGMTRSELENYPNIAMSSKPRSERTPGGRPLIGHYGIGILSALPFCKEITVQTTVRGAEEVNFLTISSGKWIDNEGRRRRPSRGELKVSCPGKTVEDNRLKDSHGTTVILEDVFPAIWGLISSPQDKRKGDIDQYSGIERIQWYLQQYAPIEYHKEAHPYVDFFEPPKEYDPLELFLNGKQLFRNSIQGANVLEKKRGFELVGGTIKCDYLIVSPGISVKPDEMRGLQIRMKNVAIGLPTHFDVYKREAKLYGRMKYITGEIEIIEGLEDQLSLDREDILKCPEWSEFSEYFRGRLAVLADKLEDFAEAEASIGALAVATGVIPDNAHYGFLKESAVRPATKKKRVRQAKNKKDLIKKARNALKKIDYKVESAPKADAESGAPVRVDHVNKVVFISETASKQTILLSIPGFDIYETESIVETDQIAKLIDKNSIAFNYKHPVLKNSRDAGTIKRIVTLVYCLHSSGEISDEGFILFNKTLNRIHGESDEPGGDWI